MFKIKHSGFTLVETAISLFVFTLIIFVFGLSSTLIKHQQQLTTVVSKNQNIEHAFLQLDHYLQRSAYVQITRENGPYRLVLWHINSKEKAETKALVFTNQSILLTDHLQKGRAPLIEGVEQVQFNRVGSYIEITLKSSGKTYTHRFFCPANKGIKYETN